MLGVPAGKLCFHIVVVHLGWFPSVLLLTIPCQGAIVINKMLQRGTEGNDKDKQKEAAQNTLDNPPARVSTDLVIVAPKGTEDDRNADEETGNREVGDEGTPDENSQVEDGETTRFCIR